MYALRIAAVAVSAVFLTSAQPARATVFDMTYRGSFSPGMDNLGLFLDPGTNLAGVTFVASLRFDTALGALSQLDDAGRVIQTDLGGGPEFSSVVSPLISASLTANGRTIAIFGEAYAVGSTFDVGTPTAYRESGAGVSAQGSGTNGGFSDTTILQMGLGNSYNAGGLFPVDLLVPFESSSLTGVSLSGSGSLTLYRSRAADGEYLGQTNLTMYAESYSLTLPVLATEVPEPASLALFGGAMLAFVARRRYRPTA